MLFVLSVIASYYPELREEEFQVWKLVREEECCEANVICTAGNDRVLKKQHLPYTDFKPLEATVWVEDNVMLLPSEH